MKHLNYGYFNEKRRTIFTLAHKLASGKRRYMEERTSGGRRRTSWSSAEKWINICLCDEILRLWPLTPQLIWFQQQSTSLKLLSNQKWMALNLLGRRRTPLTAIYPKNYKKYILKQNNQGLVMLQSELNWLLKYQVAWWWWSSYDAVSNFWLDS